ncbi:MAG: glycosyltransferase family 4 protein [Sulfurimonas sp.]
MKHIAIIDHVGKKAGMDYYSGSLARGLAQSSVQVSVYSNFTGLDPDKVDYHLLFEGHSKTKKLVKLFRLLKAIMKAAINAREKKSDLVIVHLFSADIVTLLLTAIPKSLGLRTAFISHDVSSFAEKDNRFIQNLIYNRFADFIVVHNQFSKKTLLGNIQIKEPKKVITIKHGGYLDHINQKPDKKELRRELGLEEEGKYLLFFGQIKKVKGLDILLEAMNKLPEEIKLIIAGKPWKDDFSSYDTLIAEYGLQNRVIKMIRFIEDEEREKLFFAADANILPYRIIYQSGVLLMAMSHGLPVIASDLSPNREVIENGINGLLFTSEDSDDLAKKIDQFFFDHSLQEILSHNARKTIRDKYSWTPIAQGYINMIEDDFSRRRAK